MTRTVAREIAVLVGFSAASGGEGPEDTLERFFEEEHYASLAGENEIFSQRPDPKQMDYIRALTGLVCEHRQELDGYIGAYAKGWRTERISRMAAAIIRCAMCEILYMEDIPDAAAINEAVELAKKYESEEVVSFINGVLGGFVRGEAEKKSGEEKGAENGE